MRALFVCDNSDLISGIDGGVQICSKEFLRLVQCTADEVRLLKVSVSRKPSFRVRRLLKLGSYILYDPLHYRAELTQIERDFCPTHIFINKCELLRFSALIRSVCPKAQVVLMSHGTQSGDDLYELSGEFGRRNRSVSRLFGSWQLGRDLVTESRFRHNAVDAVCVMSEEEAFLERWLGARKTLVLPRFVELSPIPYSPCAGKIGFVGTLNHTPNLAALRMMFEHIKVVGRRSLEISLIGGPVETGMMLQDEYPFVTYLGRLDDEALIREISTWALFLNPIFWLSRGASMKLRQSLSWCIPTLSTASGLRGYRDFKELVFLTDDSVDQFVQRALEVSNDLFLVNSKRDEIISNGPQMITFAKFSNTLANFLMH